MTDSEPDATDDEPEQLPPLARPPLGPSTADTPPPAE
jgi:hypothetical protein